MPSLGAHLAITWMISQDSNRDLSTPMVVGSFIPDILGCCKASHFRGESGCIYPDYKVLGTSCIPVSCWDNNPSNVELNPQIHLREFFSHNRFSNPDFALGIRSHIVADAMWTGTLPKVFDFSEQDKGIVRMFVQVLLCPPLIIRIVCTSSIQNLITTFTRWRE